MMLDMFSNIICSFLGTIGYAILYNVPKKYYIGCGITGVAGWMVFLFFKKQMMTSSATASFFGALVVVLIARMLTVRMKCPITIFLISGIFPLVPGAGIYYTVYYLVTNQLSMASLKGMESIKIVFAIVLGIVIIVQIPRDYFRIEFLRKRCTKRLNGLIRLCYNRQDIKSYEEIKQMSKVRTRFAPSPTGRMHVGNLRTALYAYLIAKHEDGDFMLRIEDTDQERFVEGALDIIYHTLKETGLEHDEGPDKDGGVGPYVQSERNASGIYLKYAKQLIEQGDAYYCFCDKERLESLKSTVSEDGGTEIVVYDKHCLGLSKEEVEANLAAGKPYVIRFNMPTEGTTTFKDDIYGDITVPNAEMEDLILIKSDGYPTYNFANVIDDHLMGITHVVRGNEYLSSAPKYNRIYEAFGWEIPTYVHCPLITDENHKKLSKRCGHSSYEDLINQGFVTEAVVNYVALLGWCPSDNREIFSLDELVKVFDYRHMSKSPAVFDIVKLKWMNGEYLKAMDFDKFYSMAEPYIKEVVTKDYDLKKIAALVKTRIEVLPDIKDQIDFFEELPEYDTSMYCHKKMKTNEENSLEVLKEVLPVLEAQEDFSNDALFDSLKKYVDEKGCKVGFVMWPVRTAVSGKQNTPGGATEIMEILGKEESLSRIRKGIELLSSK